MLRRILPFTFALALAACGGSSPAAPTPQPPAPPPPPPAPTYPSLIGTWTGSSTTVIGIVSGIGQNASQTCSEIWAINNQVQGEFNGTFQSSGACARAGSFSGSVDVNGQLTFSFTQTIGQPPGTTTCTRLSGDGLFRGNTRPAITAMSSDRISCTTGGQTLVADRQITFIMNK